MQYAAVLLQQKMPQYAVYADADGEGRIYTCEEKRGCM